MDAAQELMKRFNSLVDSKGWSVDELYDLLKHGVMFHCPPSYSSVAKWRSGDRVPRGAHLLAILTFVQTHGKDHGTKKNVSTKPRSVKTKTKTKRAS